MAFSKPKLMRQLVLLCCIGILVAALCLPQGVNSKRKKKNGSNNNNSWNDSHNYHNSKEDYAPAKHPGYDVSFKQELTYWQCDEKTGMALLGKAHNVVLDRYVGRKLCFFLNEKKRKFDKEFNTWEMNLKKNVNSKCLISRLATKLWHLMTMKKPRFFISVEVHKWYPLAYDGYGNSKHLFSASFSYEFPRGKLYGAFDGLDERFAYINKGNYQTEYVDIAASPVLLQDDRRSFMHEWWSDKVTKDKNRNREIVADIKKSLQSSSADVLINTQRFENVGGNVLLTMKNIHFWDYDEKCNAFDGRFVIMTKGSQPINNACMWIQDKLASDAANRSYCHISHSMVISVKTVDFFNNERVGFCGDLYVVDSRGMEISYAGGIPHGSYLYPPGVCLYADNNPAKQKLFRDSDRQTKETARLKMRTRWFLEQQGRHGNFHDRNGQS